MNWGAYNNNYNGVNNNNIDRHQGSNHHDRWAGTNSNNNLNSPYTYSPYYNRHRNGKQINPVNNGKVFGGQKYPDYRNRYKNDIMRGSAEPQKHYDNSFQRGQNFNNDPYSRERIAGSPGRAVNNGMNNSYANDRQHQRSFTDRNQMERMIPNRDGGFSERYRGIFGDYPANGYAALNNNGYADNNNNNNFNGNNRGSIGAKRGLGGSTIGSSGSLDRYNRQNDMMRRTLPTVGNRGAAGANTNNFRPAMRNSGTDRRFSPTNHYNGIQGGGAMDGYSAEGSQSREKRFTRDASIGGIGGRNERYSAMEHSKHTTPNGYFMPGQYNDNDYGRPKSAPRDNRFNHYNQQGPGTNLNSRIGNGMNGSAMRSTALGNTNMNNLGGAGLGGQGNVNYGGIASIYDRRIESDGSMGTGSPMSQRGVEAGRHFDRHNSPARIAPQTVQPIQRINGSKSPVRRLGETSPGRNQGMLMGEQHNHHHMSPSRNPNRSPGRSPGRVLEDYQPRIIENYSPNRRRPGMSPGRMMNANANQSPARNPNRESIGASPMRPVMNNGGAYIGSPGRNQITDEIIGSPRRIDAMPHQRTFSPIRRRPVTTDSKPKFDGRRLDGLSPRRNHPAERLGSPSRPTEFVNNHPFNHVRPVGTQSRENLDVRENYPMDQSKGIDDSRIVRRSPIVIRQGGQRHPLQESSLNKIIQDKLTNSTKKFDHTASIQDDKIITAYGNPGPMTTYGMHGGIMDQDPAHRRVTMINKFTEKTEYLKEPSLHKRESSLPYQDMPAKPVITLRGDDRSEPKRPQIFDKNFPNYRERYGNIVNKQTIPAKYEGKGRLLEARSITPNGGMNRGGPPNGGMGMGGPPNGGMGMGGPPNGGMGMGGPPNGGMNRGGPSNGGMNRGGPPNGGMGMGGPPPNRAKPSYQQQAKRGPSRPRGPSTGPMNNAIVPKTDYTPPTDIHVFGYDELPEPTPHPTLSPGNNYTSPPTKRNVSPIRMRTRPAQKPHITRTPPQQAAPPYNPLGGAGGGPMAHMGRPGGPSTSGLGMPQGSADYAPEDDMFIFGYDDPEEMTSSRGPSPSPRRRKPSTRPSTGLIDRNRPVTTIRDNSSQRRTMPRDNGPKPTPGNYFGNGPPQPGSYNPGQRGGGMFNRRKGGHYSNVNTPYQVDDPTRISNVSNLSASRDWSSRHAFQPPDCDPQADMFARKYSYGGIEQTFLSRIYNGDYKSMKGTMGFQQYTFACREELRICGDAREELLNKPLLIEPITLPDKGFGRRKTLLLDLDETLIHSEDFDKKKTYDLTVDMAPPDSQSNDVSQKKNLTLPQKIGVNIRPYAREFLQRMSKVFEIAIFTAGRQDYADKMVNMLDPNGTLVPHRLYRQRCVPFRGICVKDFRVISNRNIEDMIMIDNYVYSFGLNLKNGIPIKPYIHGQDDGELKYIADRLEKIKSYDKCSEFLNKQFKLNEFFNYIKNC